MNVKMYALSLVTITVIGCGGSNAGSCCGNGFVATANGEIVSDGNGNILSAQPLKIKKNGGSTTSTITVTSLGAGSNCSATPCTVSAVQTTSCIDDKDKPEFVALSDCEKKAVVAKIGDIADDEIIVYGGTIAVTVANGTITTCGMDVTVNMPAGDYCGQDLNGIRAGFGGDHKDNKVYALITVTGQCATTQRWVEGTITGTGTASDPFKVTFPGLQGVTLPATFSLFRVTEAPASGSGGVGG